MTGIVSNITDIGVPYRHRVVTEIDVTNGNASAIVVPADKFYWLLNVTMVGVTSNPNALLRKNIKVADGVFNNNVALGTASHVGVGVYKYILDKTIDYLGNTIVPPDLVGTPIVSADLDRLGLAGEEFSLVNNSGGNMHITFVYLEFDYLPA